MARGDTREGPQLGDPLPHAEEAYIDPAKLVQYALNLDHPVGKHKATVFQRALDIGLDDWEYLRDAILDELPHHPISASRPPEIEHEGFTWEVLVPISGLRQKEGRVLNVITAWEMIDRRPELATTRVAPKNRQEPAE